MNPEQLSPDARAALQALEQGVEAALLASKTPHATAYSHSSVEPGTTVDDAMTGGSITSPDKPFIDHDSLAITALHRAVHKAAGPDVLHAIVVHAESPARDGKWQIRTKLVSVKEHEQLVQGRQPIDAEVEGELQRLTDKAGWDLIAYGRTSPTLPVKLIRSGKGGREELQPTGNLKAQLGLAEQLYRDAGYELRVAHWTLRKGGLAFREHFV